MRRLRIAFGAVVGLAAACGSGGGGDSGSAGANPSGCDGSCATAGSYMTVTDVEDVVARAVTEAQARNAHATIAVVDRVGNVLAVFAMVGAAPTVTVRSTSTGTGIDGGLEQVNIVPASLAAISKAVTGAYLSSEGNAFTTRTASQIIQSHFNPGDALTPGGPLSGVQFSQLPCSDVSFRFTGGTADAGPKRSPLGLAADPGGFPLYKSGTPVGGVGVIADGVYGLDPDVSDLDVDLDELIALAATSGLPAPDNRRADRITVDGRTLRFSDAASADLLSAAQSVPPFAALNGAAGALEPVIGYFAGAIEAGAAFGQTSSGIRPDVLDYPGLDAFVLVDTSGVERYRPRAGTEGSGALTATEAQAILASGLGTANRARTQIRQPLNGPARVSLALVDSNGVILGVVRSRDAPVFGSDVSVQKARTAAFFSSSTSAPALSAVPPAVYLNQGLTVLRAQSPGQYVTALRGFLGLPNVLADGQVAFTSRAVGDLARPFFPDGVDGNPAGPLAKPAGQWSPFSTGLQLDLIYNALIQHVAFVSGLGPDVGANCTGVSGFDSGFTSMAPIAPIANGIQIFPGAVPIYRNGQLVGALGVSGDGTEQDDLIAFLGVQTASDRLGGGFGQAPASRRADQLTPNGSRLRYVGCPIAPFLDSSVQEPCSGL